MSLRNPNRRAELIGLLEDLSASEDISDEWIAFPDYGFDEWFNRVDDVLPEGASQGSGVVLRPEEVEPASFFLSARDAVWRDIGSHGSFEQYRQHRGWPSVIAAARNALVVMSR